MSLLQTIYDQLGRSPCNQPIEIIASDKKLLVKVILKDSDSLGCLLDKIEIRNTQKDPLSPEPSQITNRITYLGEGLEMIETEGHGGRTIIRSNPPRNEGEIISFYELVLDSSEGLSLKRHRYDDSLGERVPVAAPLTRETLERLIQDLIQLTENQ